MRHDLAPLGEHYLLIHGDIPDTSSSSHTFAIVA